MNSSRLNILVVDDDRDFLEQLTAGLGSVYKIYPCSSLEKAEVYLAERTFDFLLLDLVFGNNVEEARGIEFIGYVRDHYPSLPVLAITQYGQPQNIIDAWQQGAKTLLKDDWNALRWQEAINDEINRIDQQSAASKIATNLNSTRSSAVKASKEEDFISESHPFLGNDPAILDIKTELEALSEEPDITVLILGETGVGKEVAARYLHSHGIRRDKTFRAVNMVAIAKELLESELFGHTKGAFTGALQDKVGVFAEADGGVLFLDEIGEISPLLQQKILRFLQEKVITPVGGKERTLDIQIVSATNRDLKAEVQAGNFREDLYHRLNDFVIKIPPLRERKGDIETIALHYMQSKGADRSEFGEDIWRKFKEYHWPGNVREMMSIIRRLLLKKKISRSEVNVLDASFLPEEFFQTTPGLSTLSTSDGGSPEKATSYDPDSVTDINEKTAYNELKQIEDALVLLKFKGKVVKHLNFKNLDQLRYRVVDKYSQEYPHLFSHFPTICKKFKILSNG